MSEFTDGDVLYACDMNFLMSSAETTLENAVNIAKLQYGNSVTDIDHDYMVVDVFTDSTGYNNTLNITSNFSTAYTGCLTTATSGGYAASTPTAGNSYIKGQNVQPAGCCSGWFCYEGYIDEPNFDYDIACLCEFGFCVQFQACYTAGIYTGSNGCVTLCYTDNIDGTNNLFTACGTTSTTCNEYLLKCYCFIRDGSSCCYDLYCDGVCLCQIDITSGIPNITGNSYGCAFRLGAKSYSSICYLDEYYKLNCDVTTSKFTSTGLNGFYENSEINSYTNMPVISLDFCCTSTGGAGGSSSECSGDYYACTYATANPYSNEGILMCLSQNTVPFDITCVDYFCFQACYYINGDSVASNGAGGCIATSNWEDNKTFCCNITSDFTISQLFCYCYVKQGAGIWDFYCNGACKCQITGCNTFPDINIEISTCVNSCSNSRSCFKLVNMCGYGCFLERETNLVVQNIEYAQPISTVYMTNEQVGSGNVVYNVIDATTSNCIACNVPLNCLYPLTCCVCCHRYEIVQCSDGVSCIKSYALLAGEV